MFEDSFADILRQYPNAVADKKRFFGLMKDCFPGQQMQINLINTTFDLGIADELAKTSQITNAFAFRFVKRLVDEYGVSRINADWAVSVWCVCYGKQLLHKPCDIEISKAKSGSAPVIKDEQSGNGRQYNDLFRYKVVADGYAISSFNGPNTRTLIFPNAYAGKPVTRVLAHAFEGCDVQEAVMTDGIKVIEEGAFKGCENLKQIIYPNTLREIGTAAFSGCRNLVTAALPGNLEQIGDYAFSDTALWQVELPQNLLWLGEGVYKGCSKLSSIKFHKHLAEIPNEMFMNCIAMRKVDLPAGTAAIGREAFSGCTGLIDMIIPESVITVGSNAFAGMNPSFTLICTQRSAAEQYARTHNVPFQIVL